MVRLRESHTFAKGRGRKIQRSSLSKRRVKVLLFSFFGIVISVLGFWLWYSNAVSHAYNKIKHTLIQFTWRNGLAIDAILVDGRDHTPKNEILQALGIQKNSPILELDVQRAQETLEHILWIRSAIVERRLPDTVYIKLEERKPMALWQYNQVMQVLGDDGVPISVSSIDPFKNLPMIVGKGAPAHTPHLLQALKKNPSIQELVKSSVRVGERRWNLVLKNGITIRLPEEGIEKALQRLMMLENKHHLVNKNVSVIDLRIPDRLILKLKNKPANPMDKKKNPSGASVKI
jgi:cell division protein FtsQ